jgi:large subunit ribosomal protein L29
MAELKQKEIREQLRAMNDDELRMEISAMRAKLYDFRRKHAMKQLDNTSAIRDARKQIARALTLLRERALANQRGTI